MKRRVLIAGWVAGLVMGLSQAWWWGNVYFSMSALLCGVVLSLTAWAATASTSNGPTA